MIKYIPNLLSLLRIICSSFLIFFMDDQIIVIFLYFVIGLTDILDGFTARKFDIESELGARLDSLADFIFYIILVFIFINLYSSIFTNYKLVLIGIIFIRFLNLLLTKLKYKKIVFVHTVANKISGVILYLLPVFLLYEKSNIIIWITLVVALIAAMEELLITIRYPEVNLNRKSIFCK